MPECVELIDLQSESNASNVKRSQRHTEWKIIAQEQEANVAEKSCSDVFNMIKNRDLR